MPGYGKLLFIFCNAVKKSKAFSSFDLFTGLFLKASVKASPISAQLNWLLISSMVGKSNIRKLAVIIVPNTRISAIK
jgi:hypothetical protein